jgi:hypothetical protein
MKEPVVTGSCLCRAVRFELHGPFLQLAHCHCSLCRKHHGVPFVSWLVSTPGSYRLLAGADHIGRYVSSPGLVRPFCTTCGSVLPSAMEDQGVVVTPAGDLDGDFGPVPAHHMFVGSKAPWYEITDDLPRYAEYAPEAGLPAVGRPPPPRATPGWTGGSCACGQVAFEYEGPPLRMLNCHCSRCRKGRSAAHTTNLFVPLDRFRYTRGEQLVQDFPLPGARFFGVAFCTACGSDVARKSLPRNAAVIPAGSLDDDPGMRASAHIFVGSKAPWFTITDRLPRFEEMPP